MKLKYILLIGLVVLGIGLVVYLNIPKYDLQATADRQGNTLTNYKDGSTLMIYANGTQVNEGTIRIPVFNVDLEAGKYVETKDYVLILNNIDYIN